MYSCIYALIDLIYIQEFLSVGPPVYFVVNNTAGQLDLTTEEAQNKLCLGLPGSLGIPGSLGLPDWLEIPDSLGLPGSLGRTSR